MRCAVVCLVCAVVVVAHGSEKPFCELPNLTEPQQLTLQEERTVVLLIELLCVFTTSTACIRPHTSHCVAICNPQQYQHNHQIHCISTQFQTLTVTGWRDRLFLMNLVNAQPKMIYQLIFCICLLFTACYAPAPTPISGIRPANPNDAAEQGPRTPVANGESQTRSEPVASDDKLPTSKFTQRTQLKQDDVVL